MIIYKLRDRNRAPVLASRFETLFQHNAPSWQEREESTLQLFLTLRMSVAITVSLIILLAGFGIFNVLTMSVLAKIKEIAILRSMGYRRIDIGAIFLWQGALIAAAGSVAGLLVRRVNDLGRIAHSHSSPRLALHKLFCGDVGLAAIMRLRRYSRFWLCSSPVMSRAGAPLNCRPLSPFEDRDERDKLALVASGSNATWAKKRNACTPCAVCRSRSRLEAFTPWSVRLDVAKVRCSIFSVCSIHLTPAMFRSKPKRCPDLSDDELAQKRNKFIGFIFQFHFLMEDFTAQENVMIPMRKLGAALG